MLRFLTRAEINDAAWDGCVAGAHNALLYGHTWYLDAVTYLTGWKWEGLVLENVPTNKAGSYDAVLPIPLRWRWGRWVVYQPFFCQFLALFSKQPLDPAPFVQAVHQRYRYASKWHLLLGSPLPELSLPIHQYVNYTHVLRLTGSTALRVEPNQTYYTADRRMNLRRAARRIGHVPDWQLTESTDVNPLLTLFQENHAQSIGVASWAYGLFRRLFTALEQRGLAKLYYAWAGGQIVAGVLFVEHHGRIIYLFNAANREGRRLNARAILIDRLIQAKQKAEPTDTPPGGWALDFESPEKPDVVAFYESFGATAEPYIAFTWSRLTWLERLAKSVRQLLTS